MNSMDEEKIRKIAVEIFEVAKLYPGRLTVWNPENFRSDKELARIGIHFDSEYKNDDPKLIEKVKDFLKREENYNKLYIYPEQYTKSYKLYNNK